MANQVALDKMYMDIAVRISQESRGVRNKIGAVIVKDTNILSYGWNGTPKGFDNCCEEKEYMPRSELGKPDNEEVWPYVDIEVSDALPGTIRRYRLKTKQEVLHAESNALMKLISQENSPSTKGATLYVTVSPCPDCAKLIIQSGITRIVYKEKYRICDVAFELFTRAKINFEQLT